VSRGRAARETVTFTAGEGKEGGRVSRGRVIGASKAPAWVHLLLLATDAVVDVAVTVVNWVIVKFLRGVDSAVASRKGLQGRLGPAACR
jgi:hypothetical protein